MASLYYITSIRRPLVETLSGVMIEFSKTIALLSHFYVATAIVCVKIFHAETIYNIDTII